MQLNEEAQWIVGQLTETSGMTLSVDSPLLDSGLLDSMAIQDLVAEIEERHGFTIPDDELTEENFESASAIANLIGRLRNV